ncbi:MAG: hypothetical protein AAF502_16720 [Bacteroidota bacterium]
MKNIIIIFSLLVLPGLAIAQSPWTQKKGGGFYKLSQWWVISDGHFTDTGQIDPNVTSGVFNTSFYGQYGITDRVTAVLYFPFFSRAYFNNTISGTTGEVITPGESVNSIGDTDIGITYAILKNKGIKLSSTLLLGLPIGKSAGGESGILQTGDGEFNQLLRVDVGGGLSVKKVNLYSAAYFGFNNRTNGFSDELRYGFEVGGIFFKEKFVATLRLSGISSLENGSAADPANGTSLFANNSEHFSWSPELAYNFTDKFGVSASFGKAFSGKLIFANPAYSFGVYLKM